MNGMSPLISAIVPCRNEKDYIEACVRSILTQDPLPGGLDLLVVDGMSDDGTRDILERLAKEDSRLRIIDNPNRITPCGMNAGIREARGRYIAIMGAHNRYAQDYLIRCLEVAGETKADNVGGAMFCEGESYLSRAVAAAHHSPFSVGGARWHDPGYEGLVDTVFGGVYRREIFNQIGVFDEELIRNQDDELNLRLTRARGKIWQSPRIKSWYHPRGSLRSLFQQYLQYGYWKVRVIQKHRLPASIRHLIPAAFVFTMLLLTVLAPFWSLAFQAWSVLGILYIACNVAASLVTAGRADFLLFPILPVVFACYHIGYGYGFLRGIWDFIILHRVPTNAMSIITRVERSS